MELRINNRRRRLGYSKQFWNEWLQDFLWHTTIFHRIVFEHQGTVAENIHLAAAHDILLVKLQPCCEIGMTVRGATVKNEVFAFARNQKFLMVLLIQIKRLPKPNLIHHTLLQSFKTSRQN